MTDSVSYDEAVKVMAFHYKGIEGMFGASSLLARMFNKDKEKILEELIKLREAK